MPTNPQIGFTLPTEDFKRIAAEVGDVDPNTVTSTAQSQPVRNEQDADSVSINRLINGLIGGLGSGGVNLLRNRSGSNAIPAALGALFGYSNNNSWANPANVGNAVSAGMSAAGKGSMMQQALAPAISQTAAELGMNGFNSDSLGTSAVALLSAGVTPWLSKKRGQDLVNKGILATSKELNELSKKANEVALPDAATARVLQQLKANNTFEVSNKRYDRLKRRFGENTLNSPFITTKSTPLWQQVQVEQLTPGAQPYTPKTTPQLQPEFEEVTKVQFNREKAQIAAKLEAQARDVEKQIAEKQKLIAGKKLTGGAAQYQQKQIAELQAQAQELRAQKPDPNDITTDFQPNPNAVRTNKREQVRASVLNTPQEQPPQTQIKITPGVKVQEVNPLAKRAQEIRERIAKANNDRGDLRPAKPNSVDADVYANQKAADPLYDVANKYQTDYYRAVKEGNDVAADEMSRKMYAFRQKYPDSTAPQRAIMRKIQREFGSQIADAPLDKRILDSGQAEAIVKHIAKLTPEMKIGLFGSVEEANNFTKFMAKVTGAIAKGEERFKIRVGATGGSGSQKIGLDSILQVFDPDALVNLYYNKDSGQRTQAIRLIEALNSNDENIIKQLSQSGTYSRVLSTILEATKEPKKQKPPAVVDEEEPQPGVKIPVGPGKG